MVWVLVGSGLSIGEKWLTPGDACSLSMPIVNSFICFGVLKIIAKDFPNEFYLSIVFFFFQLSYMLLDFHSHKKKYCYFERISSVTNSHPHHHHHQWGLAYIIISLVLIISTPHLSLGTVSSPCDSCFVYVHGSHSLSATHLSAALSPLHQASLIPQCSGWGSCGLRIPSTPQLSRHTGRICRVSAGSLASTW